MLKNLKIGLVVFLNINFIVANILYYGPVENHQNLPMTGVFVPITTLAMAINAVFGYLLDDSSGQLWNLMEIFQV